MPYKVVRASRYKCPSLMVCGKHITSRHERHENDLGAKEKTDQICSQCIEEDLYDGEDTPF